MPKDLESLKDSRDIRSMLISRWGWLPSSIWKVDWRKSKNIELSGRTYQDHKESTEHADTPFSLSGVGARHGDLSRFPQDMGSFLVNFFCPKPGLVLDPFAGHNSRAECVWRTGRNYIGFDISHNFMELNFKMRDMLYEENKRELFEPNEATITLIEDDSRNILDHVDKNSADFCITSPPFYDLEYYGPEVGQLGKAKSYASFINSLSKILENCLKVLKPGAYIAWEVNEFRKDGVFYTYYGDVQTLFKNVGFILEDTIIVDYGSSFLASFLSDVEHLKIMPKRHAYIIIARKYNVGRGPKREKTRVRLLDEVKDYHDENAEQKSMF